MLGRKINLRGIGSVWVVHLAISVRVTEEGLNEKMAIEIWKKRETSLIRGDKKCSHPKAGVC